MYARSGKRWCYAIGLVSGLLASGTVALATDARAGTTRIEVPVASGSPVTSVAESEVSVLLPLPASVGPHPAQCDWLHYLRYRDHDGPSNPAQADKILVAQPGILEGAGAFDSVARDTIVQAAKLGKHIEFWALDRRSNCLEDHTGIQAGLAARDSQVALDYYYNHKQINGQTFAGFLNNDQVAWLSRVGLEQTVRDEYDLLVAELPDQAVRKQKVLCGGHSLGGVITGDFAVWDFDGNPATTTDAGFNQCSGYFALDTTINTSLADLSGSMPTGMLPDVGIGYAAIQAALDSGALTRTLSLPAVINAETMNFLAIAGLAANTNPNGETLVPAMPSDDNLNTTARVLFSKDLGTFLAGTPTVRDFHITNAAVLGGLMDDNSQPLSFLESSVGFFDGGPITDKQFPLPADALNNPVLSGLRGLIGTQLMAIPSQPRGPLYTWRNYNRIGAPDDPGYRSANGQPFTTPGEEVTDMQELARSLSEQPLDFTEQYFPTKLAIDIMQVTSPQIAQFLVHPEGLKANPIITLLAGDGLLAGGGRTPPPTAVNPVIAPGYQHLDVLTAAPDQNNGQPEPVSTNLARFAASAP